MNREKTLKNQKESDEMRITKNGFFGESNYETEEIKVGDIMESSWGYDQTNVDFFKIVKMTGKTIWIQPVKSKFVSESGFMSNTVVPTDEIKTQTIFSNLIQCRLNKFGRFSINGQFGLGKWDGTPMLESHYA
jgi:hypothetical protein